MPIKHRPRDQHTGEVTRIALDRNSIASMDAAIRIIQKWRDERLAQIAADYGQFLALNGHTSPEKRKELGPKE